MGIQFALPRTEQALTGGFRLPPCVPPFNTLTYRLSRVWLLVFLLAFVGPIAGLYERDKAPGTIRSFCLAAARSGCRVACRWHRGASLVGPQAERAGIVAGDKIIVI